MKNMSFRVLRKFVSLVCLLVLMLVLTSACKNGGTVVYQGNINYTKEDLVKKPFTEIEVGMVADVYYTQTDQNKQEVRFDFSKIENPELRAKFQNQAKAVYRDGKLIIGLGGKVSGTNNLKKGERVQVYITSTDLTKVTMEGVGSFNAESINSDVFNVDNEGVGNIHIAHLLANKVEADNEGVGSILLGQVSADRFSVNNEGVGHIKVTHFKGGKLDVSNDGVGSVVVDVDCQSVEAELDGVGSIQLSGTTRRFDKEKDGVGSFKISKLNIVK